MASEDPTPAPTAPVVVPRRPVPGSRGRVIATCPNCGKEFEIFRCKQKRFCSTKCSAVMTRGALTHGGSGTRLHNIWNMMRERCSATEGRAFKYYASRGIRVCSEWLTDFAAFRTWALASGYRDDLSIDRRENGGPYSPDNCRWITQGQQKINVRKRSTKCLSQFKGVTKRHGRWIAQVNLNKVRYLLGSFPTEEEAARAYDAKAKELFGEFACLNFPEPAPSPPALPVQAVLF